MDNVEIRRQLKNNKLFDLRSLKPPILIDILNSTNVELHQCGHDFVQRHSLDVLLISNFNVSTYFIKINLS